MKLSAHGRIESCKLRVVSFKEELINKFSIIKTKLSPLTSHLSPRSGFTLIELLVVIGILGILAAALVATIDPFEQLNKGSDARTENTLVEFQNGLLRYYTLRGQLPWNDVDDDCMAGAAPASSSIESISACLDDLIAQGELKASFANSPDLPNIYVTEESTNNVVLCYEPISKSKQRDVNTIYDIAGAAGTDCKSAGGATDCYWCSR